MWAETTKVNGAEAYEGEGRIKRPRQTGTRREGTFISRMMNPRAGVHHLAYEIDTPEHQYASQEKGAARNKLTVGVGQYLHGS